MDNAWRRGRYACVTLNETINTCDVTCNSVEDIALHCGTFFKKVGKLDFYK